MDVACGCLVYMFETAGSGGETPHLCVACGGLVYMFETAGGETPHLCREMTVLVLQADVLMFQTAGGETQTSLLLSVHLSMRLFCLSYTCTMADSRHLSSDSSAQHAFS